MDKINTIVSPEFKAFVNKYSPFLKEVRKRILITLIVFSFSTIFGFVFYEQIVRFVIRLLLLDGINIVFTSPFQFINLAVSCGVATGLMAVMPLFIIQIIAFLRPALKRKEFRMVLSFLPFSIILFIIGFTFGAVIMKWQIGIFINRSESLGIGNMLDISRLLSTVLMTSVLMGIGFQFPIFLLLMIRIGIIQKQQLSKKRPWVYLFSFFFALLLPPDSILADILLSLPLIILFEITLLLSQMFKKRKIGTEPS